MHACEHASVSRVWFFISLFVYMCPVTRLQYSTYNQTSTALSSPGQDSTLGTSYIHPHRDMYTRSIRPVGRIGEFVKLPR